RKLRKKMRRSVVFASTVKRFVHGQGNPGTALPSLNFCFRARAFSVASDDYREKLRNGVDDAIGFLVLCLPLFGDALDLFGEMESKGIRPDVMERCLRLLSDMIERNIDANVVTFSALTEAFAKEGKLLEAERLYEEMIGRSIDPNIFTYSSLINGFCMQSRLEEAKRMFDLMVSKGCLPDVVIGLVGNTVTYNTPIQGFFQAEDCENAQQVFKQMVSAGVPPDIWTYNILLDGLCNNGKLEKALVVFQDMQKSEVELGMCKAGKVEDAWDLFSCLSLKGVKPNVVTCNTMISGLCRKDLLQEADALFRKMKEDGPLPDSGTYNALIGARLRDAASAELIKEMRSCGFAGDVSTVSLVTNIAPIHLDLRWDEAQIVARKLVPYRRSFYSQYKFRDGEGTKSALNLLRTMEESHIKANAVIYNHSSVQNFFTEMLETVSSFRCSCY
ncbi:unnamed protein product, partial [Thlaspi arvense]